MACWRVSVAAFACFLAFVALSGGGRVALADADIQEDGVEMAISASTDASVEFGLLKSKIAALESSVEARTHELQSKDDRIVQLEQIIQEKSDTLASMQIEIDFLQKKKTADAEDRIGKARARAGELENQIAVLKSKIDLENKKRESLQLRATNAEKKTKELTSQVSSLEATIEEQKSHILKLEKARLLPEKKLLKAQSLAESKMKELSEARNAWLPHWVALYSIHLQSLAANKWNEYGKPKWNFASQKIVEGTSKFQEWARPHIEKVSSRWIPVLKEKCLEISNIIEPHVRTVAAKSVEVYGELKTAATPHIVEVKKVVYPYLEEAQRISKPYVDQIATVAKPHVDKVTFALKPYSKQAVRVYQKSLKTLTTYHRQVQTSVRRTLKENEFTTPLATKEIVWYLASVILALPVFVLYNVYFILFRKKVKKATRAGQSSAHTQRRHKRRHA